MEDSAPAPKRRAKFQVKSNRLYTLIPYLISFLLGFSIAGYQFSLSDISREFGMGNSGMGVIATARAIGMILLPLLVSFFADKLPKKRIAQIFGWLYVAFSLLMGLGGGNFYIVLLSVFFIYSCSTTLYASLVIILAETAPQKTNQFSNILGLVNGLASMVYPIILGALMSRGMSWRGHYFILSALVGLTLLAFFFIAPKKVYQVEIKKDEQKKKFNWRDTRFLALCLLLFLNVVMDTSIGYFAKPFFASELHSASGAAICISIINGGMLPAKYFASRVRKRKREMIFITFLGLAGATLLMAAVRGAVTSLIWCLVCGIFLGPQYSTIQGLAVDIFPEHSGRVSMLLLPFSGAASAIATVLMGALSDGIGAGNAFYPLVAIALLSAVPAYLFMRDKRRAADEEQNAA